MLPSWLSPGVAASLSAAAVILLLRAADRFPRDLPNARSLHTAPVPRAGGIAIWSGYVPAMLAGGLAPPGGSVGWAALAALVAVSLLDDRRGLSAAVRLVVQLGAAVALACVLLPDPGVASALVVALVLAWAANLYNFMDGNDGLAGAMTVCGFTALAGGTGSLAAAAPLLVVAAAAMPFLCVNWPPARMFMGDAGSVPLGFLAAGCSIAGVVAHTWPPWFPLLAFLPFVADATVTLARRALRGERVWQAHRSHYYQRLHQLGAGHRGTLYAGLALFVGTGGSAVATLHADGPGWLVLGLWIAILAALFVAIDYHWRTSRSDSR